MNVHEGHRERMKRRFAEHGLDNFDDVNVLELLLFYVRPRCDTNGVAHALLARFGSLNAVFEAPVEELRKVSGVGYETAVFLRLVPQVSRRYQMSKSQTARALTSSAEAGRYVTPLFLYEKEEVVYMICLDASRRVLCCRQLGRGVVNSTEVSVRRIVELALGYNASSVILAHNHPDGIALPSREDELTTRQVSAALALVGVSLADHIIVTGEDYVSLADSGLLPRV